MNTQLAMWNSFGAQACLLPYLDQAPLYAALNFSLSPLDYDNSNTTVVYRVVSTFICPSDTNAGVGHQDINDYAASFGTTTDDLYDWDVSSVGLQTNLQVPHGSSGLFTFGIAYGLRDCTDGTSSTVAYSEWVVGDGRGTYYGNQDPGSTYRGNGFLTATGNNPAYASAFQNSSAVLAGLQASLTSSRRRPSRSTTRGGTGRWAPRASRCSTRSRPRMIAPSRSGPAASGEHPTTGRTIAPSSALRAPTRAESTP